MATAMCFKFLPGSCSSQNSYGGRGLAFRACEVPWVECWLDFVHVAVIIFSLCPFLPFKTKALARVRLSDTLDVAHRAWYTTILKCLVNWIVSEFCTKCLNYIARGNGSTVSRRPWDCSKCLLISKMLLKPGKANAIIIYYYMNYQSQKGLKPWP